MWFSGLSAGLQTEGSLVRFPVRVASQVPSRGRARGNHTLMFLSHSSSLSLSPSLKINSLKKNADSIYHTNYSPISLQWRSAKEFPVCAVSHLSHHFPATAPSRTPMSSLLWIQRSIHRLTSGDLWFDTTDFSVLDILAPLGHRVCRMLRCSRLLPLHFSVPLSGFLLLLSQNADGGRSQGSTPRSAFLLPWQPHSVSWLLNVICLPTAPQPSSLADSFLVNERLLFPLFTRFPHVDS